MSRHTTHTTHGIRRFCTAALCYVGLCLAAHAAPPASRPETGHAGPKLESAKFDTAIKLDLRPPAPTDADAGKPFGRFGRAGTEMQSESLHTSDGQDRVSGVRAMAERFHREGLPVARLWENHAALVSLGLNGKGKPGIWLVQKIH